MRLGRRQPRNDEAQIDLTSMLDIVFIMLYFFHCHQLICS